MSSHNKWPSTFDLLRWRSFLIRNAGCATGKRIKTILKWRPFRESEAYVSFILTNKKMYFFREVKRKRCCTLLICFDYLIRKRPSCDHNTYLLNCLCFIMRAEVRTSLRIRIGNVYSRILKYN